MFNKDYFPLLTAPAKSEPALNFTTFLAAILISFPVWGLRPKRAARLATEKDPNPTKDKRSPFFNALLIASIQESNARPESALVNFYQFAIASINSAFFMFFCF